jgi:hypothetical protein
VAPVSHIIRNGAFYTGKTVSVTGRVKSLNQWRSRFGKFFYQTFFICQDGDCIHVFLESPSPLRPNALVSVRGPYYRAYRSAKTVSHNEIEATEVLARE